MRKKIGKLSLHRETLRQLDAELRKARGGDNKDPFTETLPPTDFWSCDCPPSTMCAPTIYVC